MESSILGLWMMSGLAAVVGSPTWTQDCAKALEGIQAAVITILPDGTEIIEGGKPSEPSREEQERRRIEEDDYYRRRQPQIVPVEELPKKNPDPVPGVHFPLPDKPGKKDLPN